MLGFPTWLAGGAIFGVIAGFWNNIKNIVWRIIAIFIVRVDFDHLNTELTQPLLYLLKRKYYLSFNYDRTIVGRLMMIKATRTWEYVYYDELGKRNLVFWNGIFPLFFVPRTRSENKEGNGNASTDVSSNEAIFYGIQFHIYFLRGTFDINGLVAEAAKLGRDFLNDNLQQDNSFYIDHIGRKNKRVTRSDDGDVYRSINFNPVSHKKDEIGIWKREISALDSLFFPQDVKNLINEIRLWHNSKEWYQKRNIPWKRGWAIHGLPGTGKSALARALSEDLRIPMYVFHLNELGNQQFREEWDKYKNLSLPKIVLFEDFDNVFHGRKYVGPKRSYFPRFNNIAQGASSDNYSSSSSSSSSSDDDTELAFDTFLNCLDGVDRTEGIFTIITTNDITKLDPALAQPVEVDGKISYMSTRPGRVDRVIYLGYMEPENKKEMASFILDKYPHLIEQMHREIDEQPRDETPAQFQDRCCMLALQELWSNN